MIGSFIRVKQGKVTERVWRKILAKPYFSVLGYDEKEKIVNFAVKLNTFLLSLAFFLAVTYLFTKIIYNNIGFEKTIVLMVAIILFILRNNREQESKSVF